MVKILRMRECMYFGLEHAWKVMVFKWVFIGIHSEKMVEKAEYQSKIKWDYPHELRYQVYGT